MFRLVKVLNGYTQGDVKLLKHNKPYGIPCGVAVIYTNQTVSTPSASAKPEYVTLATSYRLKSPRVNAILVTENMIFKVEFIGNSAPAVGMSVGLASSGMEMDSVSYNSNGKGTIIGIERETGLVYVRFSK